MSPESTLILRRESLRDALPTCVDLLRLRRASEIETGHIEDYVALDWLEWHAGGLRLTVVGENIRRQVMRRHLLKA
ncbi:hypothetical protein [Ideonella sp. B508-1]|uniref:hypothetical protein n=1 Tax=Ideonella sp. B508-1 TaxID=137716 RepID=UPI00034B4418|nr:hypothetical protein [Ideonella sp. B508-1]